MLHGMVFYPVLKIHKPISFLPHNTPCHFAGLRGSNESPPCVCPHGFFNKPGDVWGNFNLGDPVADAAIFSFAQKQIPNLLYFILPSVRLHWSHVNDFYSDLTGFSTFC